MKTLNPPFDHIAISPIPGQRDSLCDCLGVYFMENEIWKDVKGYEGIYQISSYGAVKSIKSYFIDSIGRRQPRKEKLKIPQLSNCGYLRVQLFDRYHKSKNRSIHALVAKAFIKNPKNKPEVNHKDGVKYNNFYKNLEWNTSSENQKHAFKNGLQKIRRGEELVYSKLKATDILNIRNQYKQGNISQLKLAKKFNVSQSQIWRIINKTRWTHVN